MSAQSSPFTKVVVEAIKKLYPESLADKSFDNTGLLLEAPHRRDHLNNTVLLTNDLTTGVAEEAIKGKHSVIVTYHPIIFRGLKSLSLGNSQHNSLLRLAQEGISVYSPHTAVDAAPGGVNDWIADVVTTEPSGNGVETQDVHERSVVKAVSPTVSGFEEAGYGRIVRFQTPQKLGSIIRRVHLGFGGLPGLCVAVPQSVPQGFKSEMKISTVGICAGSGGSLLNGLDVDLLVTGELSHHEALAAIESGKCVIQAFHSNTERAFLAQRMQGALLKQIENEIESGMTDEGAADYIEEGDVSVHVSQVDRDPYEIVVAGQTGW